MPNYCNNTLSISANNETLREIFSCIKGENSSFDFNKIIPMPNTDNWYNWCCKNWGTKWNSVDSTIDGSDINFLTAWSPAIPVIEALAKKFPQANFFYSYYEDGMCYCGAMEYQSGCCVYEMHGDYQENFLYEESDSEADKYSISDPLNYPVPDDYSLFVDTEGFGCCRTIHLREYGNKKIHLLIDGQFTDMRTGENKRYF